MAQRKSWGALSPAYRKRLERGGVTESAYSSGGDLAKARGHGTKNAENERRQFLRSRKVYIEMTAAMLGRDEEEQEEHFMLYTEGEQMEMMEAQEGMFSRYRSGDKEGAAALFRELQLSVGYLPYWLTPYHGKRFPS